MMKLILRSPNLLHRICGHSSGRWVISRMNDSSQRPGTSSAALDETTVDRDDSTSGTCSDGHDLQPCALAFKTRIFSAVLFGLGFFILYLVIPRHWSEILTHNDYFFADVAENTEGLRDFVFGRPLHRHVLFSLLGHPIYRAGLFFAGGKAVIVPTALAAGWTVFLFFFWPAGRVCPEQYLF